MLSNGRLNTSHTSMYGLNLNVYFALAVMHYIALVILETKGPNQLRVRKQT